MIGQLDHNPLLYINTISYLSYKKGNVENSHIMKEENMLSLVQIFV